MASITKNFNFIAEPDANLCCVICLELASQPKQCEDCGKLFCSECIEKNGRRPCPNCRTVNPKYFKDVKSRRDIDELQVRCTNSEKGCQWTGTVGTLDDHIASCQVSFSPKKLSDQYKIVTEQYKILFEEHQGLTDQHKMLSEQHKTLSNKYIELLGNLRLQEEQQKMKRFVFPLNGYASKVKRKVRFESPPFYNQDRYKMSIVIDVNGKNEGKGTHLSVFAMVLESDHGRKFRIPLQGNVIIELLNQIEDKNHHLRVIKFEVNDDVRFGHGNGYPKFIPHSALDHNPATNTLYLLDDTLYFRASVKMDNHHKPWLI